MDKTVVDHNDKFSNLKLHVIVFQFTKVVVHTHYLYHIYVILYFRTFSCICFISHNYICSCPNVQEHLTKDEDQQDRRAYNGASAYYGREGLLWDLYYGEDLHNGGLLEGASY